MIRAVGDSNILISGAITPKSVPWQVLEAARRDRYKLITSDAIIAETMRALSNEKFRQRYRITSGILAGIERLLQSVERTPLTIIVQGVATHPEDDLILSAALSAGADYLVTGDRQLLALGQYGGVAIVTPRRFLDILNADGAL